MSYFQRTDYRKDAPFGEQLGRRSALRPRDVMTVRSFGGNDH
jgi:hypothetical protein